MYVHSCCCIYFFEWSSFYSNWFYKFFSKGLTKSWKNKMEKDFPSPSLSWARPTSLLPPPRPRPAFPPFPFLSRRGPAPARPSQRRTPLPFAAADDRAGPRSSVTATWGPAVTPVPYLESGQDTSPSSTPARDPREQSLPRQPLAL